MARVIRKKTIDISMHHPESFMSISSTSLSTIKKAYDDNDKDNDADDDDGDDDDDDNDDDEDALLDFSYVCQIF